MVLLCLGSGRSRSELIVAALYVPGQIAKRQTVTRNSSTSMREVTWFFRLASPIAFAIALSLAVVRLTPGWDRAWGDAFLAHHSVLFVLLLSISVASCALASWHTSGRERQAWWLLGLGVAMMAVADVGAVTSGGTPGPALSPNLEWPTILWLLSFVPHLHGLVSFLETPWTIRSVRSRHVVDIMYAVLLTSLSAFAVAVVPAYGQSPSRPMTAVLANFVAMSCGVGVLLYAGTRRPRVRSWHVLLLAATLLVVAGGTFGFSTIALSNAGGPDPQPPFAPWAIAYALIAAAGASRTLAGRNSPREYVVYAEEPSYVPGLIATVVLFLSLPLLVYQIQSWEGPRLGYIAYAIVLTLGCLVSVGRNALVVVENASLRRQSTIDPLTGLSNHRQFHERLEAEIVRSGREGIPLSVVIIDVDDFDRVNNVYGHRTGDERLRSIADSLTSSSRGFDAVCRIGGDEFALIMPSATAIEAYGVCMRVQERLGHGDGVCDLPVSLSMGIASYPEHAETRTALVHKADGALYWAKYHGRHQIVVYNPELIQALGPEQRISLLEEESYLNMVQMLAAAVDARDPYTRLHSNHVAGLAIAFAKDLEMDSATCELLETAALLHDVGKVGVTDDVLLKPTALTEEEMDLVKEHPSLAVHILGSIPKQEILPWIESHHERWDGSGYPCGLATEEIPLEARILALCDSYDAMTTNRPYRHALSQHAACAEIMRCVGTQFDPCLAERFIAMIERTGGNTYDPDPEAATLASRSGCTEVDADERA